jgi:hypothetical protein
MDDLSGLLVAVPAKAETGRPCFFLRQDDKLIRAWFV